MKLRVFVPGTSANLGPGFDVFGLAINLHNEFCVETADELKIIVTKSQEPIPTTKENLFYQSFEYLFKKVGQPVPKVRISMNLQVRQGRGFGSSATAVVGGLVAANAFLHNKFSKDELLPFAIELEQGAHPDNVAPALFGGLVITTMRNSVAIHVKVPFPPEIKAVYFIPDFVMDTPTGRKLMPTHYEKAEVIFNTSRIALFMAALQTKKYDLLREAMDDRIHQPTRSKIFPAMPDLIRAANEAGALGTALSGGGSAIIALANKNFRQIADAMQAEALKHRISGVTKILETVNEGVFLSCDEVVNDLDSPLRSFAEGDAVAKT